jgi:hypothetical protein
MRRGLLDAEDIGEDAGGVVARIDLIVNAFDDAVLIDKKTYAIELGRGGTRASAVGESANASAIAQQWKCKIVPGRERRIFFGRVEADADDSNVTFVEVRLMVAKAAAFEGASGGAGLGKKPEQDFVAAETRERQFTAVVSRQDKIGRGISCSNQNAFAPKKYDFIFESAN